MREKSTKAPNAMPISSPLGRASSAISEEHGTGVQMSRKKAGVQNMDEGILSNNRPSGLWVVGQGDSLDLWAIHRKAKESTSCDTAGPG